MLTLLIFNLFLCKSWSQEVSEVAVGSGFAALDDLVLASEEILTTNTTATLITSISSTFINDSAVSLSWTYNGGSAGYGYPNAFLLEMANGSTNLDFTRITTLTNPKPSSISSNTYTSSYTISSLASSSSYSIRIIPIFPNAGNGFPSAPFIITTLTSPGNYWESLTPRRLSEQAYGQGFSGSLSSQPILNTGVEIFTANTHDNALWFSDPPAASQRVFPAGRRGHSMTLGSEGVVYLFGGRTNGYTCADTVMDLLNYGSTDSGVYNYPCVTLSGEVNELWTFDINTYQWSYLNTSLYPTLTTIDGLLPSEENSAAIAVPPRREQHNAVMLNHSLYIFGGKSRIHSLVNAANLGYTLTATGDLYPIDTPILTNASDIVYQDLWELTISQPVRKNFTWQNHSQTVSKAAGSFASSPSTVNIGEMIPQTSLMNLVISPTIQEYTATTGTVLLYANDPRDGQCITDLTVQVTLTHPCVTQLQISLLGPGPATASYTNFPSSDGEEVLLLANLASNSSNCIAVKQTTFVFNDRYINVNNSYNPSVVYHDSYPIIGYYAPQGRLATFLGTTVVANYTLQITDLTNDDLVGYISSWTLSLTSTACQRQYTWKNLTTAFAHHSGTVIPPARYNAMMLGYESCLYLFAGYDAYHRPIVNDLYRYDIRLYTWTVLTPAADFYSTLQSWYTQGAQGANYVLTTHGLFKYGGYYPLPITSTSTDVTSNYGQDVYLLDINKMAWKSVQIESDSSSSTIPTGRYLSSLVFLPASSVAWQTNSVNDSLLFTKTSSERSDTQANYQGRQADSLLLFGGFNGNSGIVLDGSGGGLFNDVHMLRLNTYSTRGARSQQDAYLQASCSWRSSSSAVNHFHTQTCVTGSTALGSSPCKLRDLLMLVWCAKRNETLQ